MTELPENIAPDAAELCRELAKRFSELADIASVTQLRASTHQHQSQRDANQLLAPKQAAHLLNVSISLLEKWRREGKGPVWIRLEGQRAVRYRHSDLIDFISRGRVK